MRYLKILVIIGIVTLLVSCDSCKSSSGPENPAYMTSGWEYFMAGKYTQAVDAFNKALEIEATNTEAKVGKGWSLLMKDTSSTDQVISLLTQGTKNPSWKMDSHCALTSARLIKKDYKQAIENADSLIAAESNYVFQYKTEIDWKDIKIIKSQAQFLIRKYTEAWNTIADISDLNLAPNDSKSWVIDGKEYMSFPAALSVEIANLSREYRSF